MKSGLIIFFLENFNVNQLIDFSLVLMLKTFYKKP